MIGGTYNTSFIKAATDEGGRAWVVNLDTFKYDRVAGGEPEARFWDPTTA